MHANLVAANPNAFLNSETGEVADKKVVYRILRARCCDDPNDPTDTWRHQARLSKSALTPSAIVERLKWAEHTSGKKHKPRWLYKKLAWVGLCNSILPRTEKRQAEQTLSRKGKNGWGSKKTKNVSKNLKGSPSALKQCAWDCIRV